jgi:hypothetical protein
MRWDLFVIILVVYNCIQLPFSIAFQNIFSSVAVEIVSYVIDTFFLLDIVFNFRTGYSNVKTGLEILD